jgi:hypothetical protein
LSRGIEPRLRNPPFGAPACSTQVVVGDDLAQVDYLVAQERRLVLGYLWSY